MGILDKEHIIQLVNTAVDPNDYPLNVLVKVTGPDITNGTMSRVRESLDAYQKAFEGEWDTEGIHDVIRDVFTKEGYEVEFRDPDFIIEY